MAPASIFSQVRTKLILRSHEQCSFSGSQEQVAKQLREQTTTIGYSNEEIQHAEAETNLRFPLAFQDYLRVFGKRCELLFVGTDLLAWQEFVPARLRAQGELEYWNLPKLVPDDAIVFLEHQGYDWAFIQSEDVGDDPPVYWCNEGGNREQAAESLTQFILLDAGVTVDSPTEPP